MPTVRVPALSNPRGLRADALLHVAASGLLALGIGAAIGHASDLGPAFLLTAGSFCLIGATVLLLRLPRRLPGDRFGRANTVTATRLALTCVLAATLVSQPWSGGLAWSLVALAATALALDGFDGWLARRYQEATRFGARFDMEVDALFLLVLSLLVATVGKAGLWILLAGLWRYGFVAAGLLWPPLNRPLPPSQRRKGAFVLQAVLLIACLAPSLSTGHSAWVAGLGLLLLSASFALDLHWLIRNRNSR